MSRIAKWKLDKTKVKVVFRLQFHATHIPQSGWDKLFISFIPADSGKAIAKTTKANVRNGSCKWADPIYETTKLLQDVKTKQYDEKLYKFVVAMGSSRSSILGEANINLADYADASKPSAIALPLDGLESGPLLHVTVQLLTSKTGFREFEQQRELRERGLQTSTNPNSHDESPRRKGPLSEDITDGPTDKVHVKNISKELRSQEEEVRISEDYADSATGFDGSSNTSESISAEKHELSGFSLAQSPQPEKVDPTDYRLLAQKTNDWSQGSGSEYSADNDLAIVHEENCRLRRSLEVAESSITELKLEMSSLQNHANEIGIEIQIFSQKLSSEVTSGKELAVEVLELKSECAKLKADLNLLKSLKSSLPITSKEVIKIDPKHLTQELEIRWLKAILIMEEKLRVIQNKAACVGFQERDLVFLHSDLEEMLYLLQDFKQVTQQSVSGLNCQYQSETMHHCLSIPGLGLHISDSLDATNAMKGKVLELVRELDESKAEQESLVRKMAQMECYYEALIQELEENQGRMMGELQSLRKEHATSLYTIATTKADIETMHLDMNKQLMRFAQEKHGLESLNKELEKRATTAEVALKRVRLNYSIAVNQLQKDLELLSSQVVSMFETNENLIKQVYIDPSLPSCHGYSEMVEKNHFAGVKKQQLSENILSDNLNRSLNLQEEVYWKVEDDLGDVYLRLIYLDVFSKILQETLCEANDECRLMKKDIDALTQQLVLSTNSEEFLILRLKKAMDEVDSLNQFQATYIAKYNEVALKTEDLEANLQSANHENCLLTQKITECEAQMMEYKDYGRKFQACSAEKLELENSLKKERMENENLQNKISCLHQELKAVITEFDGMVPEREKLQSIVNFNSSKLRALLVSYYRDYKGLSLLSESVEEDVDSMNFTGLALYLEELNQNSCKKILELIEDNKVLIEERNVVQESLSKAESDNLIMKEKFENGIRNMVDGIDLSNVRVRKIQLEAEAISTKLNGISEAEEKFMQQHRELVSDLNHLEGELQELSSKNQELSEEIAVLGSVNEELKSCKLTMAVVMGEKEALMGLLQEKEEESTRLKLELNTVNESLQSLHDDLGVEKSFRDKLENTVSDLDSELEGKNFQLLQLDQLKSELASLRMSVSDLESEKSRVHNLFLQSEESLENLRQENSSLSCLETQFSEMHELLFAAEVRLVFTKTQYQVWIEDLVEQLSSKERNFSELWKEYLKVQNALNCCLANEVHHKEENARMLQCLNSPKPELKDFATENRELLDINNDMTIQLNEFRNKIGSMETAFKENKTAHTLEVERLKLMLVASEEEIDNLILSEEELELKYLVLKSKLDEQRGYITMLEGSCDELILMQNKCSELSHRLSEQILKTEEFKNLCTHLKELKDKAEAECHQTRGKREPEGPPIAMQESLRIVFIKEQYETKLQELSHQLSVSKKHSEEMLWKLQDAMDEVENRKKLEVSHLKRNEQLGMKILELEAELNSVVSAKREIMMAYDLVEAEKECSSISLECCKEENRKLEASLQKCNEEKSEIDLELNHLKELLESCKSPASIQQENNGTEIVDCKPDGLVFKDPDQISQHSTTDVNMELPKQHVVSREVNGLPGLALLNEGNDHFTAESLRSSMALLNEELEKMKSENSLLNEDNHSGLDFPGVQGELLQLHKTNEKMACMYPLFKEFSSSGNALERVLALEIELAEALQEKKKSSFHFQSSFLRQHSDEEAVFQSFRDINELIKDMLELKGKHTAMQSELKEMHDRYSQLSLQFAEVEGERQKLMMTLKTVRSSNKSLINRSSSLTLDEHSS